MGNTKTLLLVRHAKSSHEFPFLDDKLRPLNSRGKSDSSLIGNRLVTLGLIPDVVYCSSSVRTQSTLAILNRHLEIQSHSISYHDDLYTFDDDGATYVNYLQNCDSNQSIVMVLSHNNSCINTALGISQGKIESFPTCGVLICRWEELDWSQVSLGNIESYSMITPKMLKG